MVAPILTTNEFESRHVRPKSGRALIVGSHVYKTRTDRRALYTEVIGVDLIAGEGVDRVMDMEESMPDDFGPFAHVECISVLEHSKRPWLIAANIERLLELGGTLYVSLPFVWRIHAYPNDYWRLTTEGVRLLFPSIVWRVLQYVPGTAERLLPVIEQNEIKYFPRTETCGFGVRV